jgi:hypothetical protein
LFERQAEIGQEGMLDARSTRFRNMYKEAFVPVRDHSELRIAAE